MTPSLWGLLFFFQICVNDDLVAKKFAHYHSQSVDGKWLDEAEQTPIMLSHSVLMQTAGRTVKKETIDKINLPPGQHTPHTHTRSLSLPYGQIHKEWSGVVNCGLFCRDFVTVISATSAS